MDKTELEKLLAEGRSVRSIAGELGCSPTKVWYWMDKFSLSPVKGLRTRNIPKEEVDRISTAVSTSRSYGESLSKLNKSSHGSTYKALKRWVKELGLDISHFLNKSEIHKIRGEKRRLSADAIFCENSTVDRHTLKKRTIRDSVVEYVCQKCGQNDMWNGERIALILDHINGVNNDNRKENLRFVCPNCEATLSTHLKDIVTGKQIGRAHV